MYCFSDAQVHFMMGSHTVNEETGEVIVCIGSGITGGFQTGLTVELSAEDGKASQCKINACLE